MPMFGIGGLTGLPLGLAPSDIHLHDTYYVIGHFHYVVAPGTIFALFAGIYYWFPKATGRKMNDTLGLIHFVGSFIAINLVFFPMFIEGLAGMNRRMYDGGLMYTHNAGVLHWNVVQGYASWALGLFQIPFIVNFFMIAGNGTRAPAFASPYRVVAVAILARRAAEVGVVAKHEHRAADCPKQLSRLARRLERVAHGSAVGRQTVRAREPDRHAVQRTSDRAHGGRRASGHRAGDRRLRVDHRRAHLHRRRWRSVEERVPDLESQPTRATRRVGR